MIILVEILREYGLLLHGRSRQMKLHIYQRITKILGQRLSFSETVVISWCCEPSMQQFPYYGIVPLFCASSMVEVVGLLILRWLWFQLGFRIKTRPVYISSPALLPDSV